MILSSASSVPGGAGLGWALAAWSIAALAAYAVVAALGERRAHAARGVLLAGWLAHAVAIGIDLLGFGAPNPGARFGFGPALSMTAWLVLAVYGIESRFVPIPGLRRTLALVAAAAVIVAAVFPGEFRPHATSPWAPLHWVLGIASYGLFGAAVFHAVLLNRAERQMRERLLTAAAGGGSTGVPLLRLERLTFHFVAAGFAMLTAALVAGVGFTATWRWDHKTVFSILGWVVFAGLLLGRRAFGWRGLQATRWLYAGATLLLLAYVGSRFVFEVLLHRPPASPVG